MSYCKSNDNCVGLYASKIPTYAGSYRYFVRNSTAKRITNRLYRPKLKVFSKKFCELTEPMVNNLSGVYCSALQHHYNHVIGKIPNVQCVTSATYILHTQFEEILTKDWHIQLQFTAHFG